MLYKTKRGKEMIEHVRLSILLGIYGSLLTERQLEILDNYYNDDMSLSEIAEKFDISRQAVLDNVKKGEKKLLEYEDKLHILSDQEARKNKIGKIQDILSNKSTQKDVDTINKLLKQID